MPDNAITKSSNTKKTLTKNISTIDKQIIKDELRSRLEEKLKNLEEVVGSSKELVQSGDLKSDGKYDTRAIESGYLASAQAKRVEEVKQDIELIDSIDLDLPSGGGAKIGSLVRVELSNHAVSYHTVNYHIENNQTASYTGHWYFLASAMGGEILKVGETPVLVLSVFSKLGSEMVGLEVDDEFEVESHSGTRHYTLKEIF